MFDIPFTARALAHLKALRKYDQKKIVDGIERFLRDDPALETTNRKRLRPNKLAEWELRIGRLRVFYDVLAVDLLVKIEAGGFKKGSALIIEGEEYQL